MNRIHKLVLHTAALISFNYAYGAPYYRWPDLMIKEMREHMPFDLLMCNTLKDVENLLRKEERECLQEIQIKFKVPEEKWRDFLRDIERKKKKFRNDFFKKKKPVVYHTLCSVDRELYQSVIKSLEMYGINSNSIDIIFDEEFHEKNKSVSAYAFTSYSSEYGEYAKISFKPCHLVEKWEMSMQKKHVPFHEAMHLWEIHPIQTAMLKRLLLDLGYMEEDIENNYAYKKWNRFHEKMCELLPSVQFKDIKLVRCMFSYCLTVAMNVEQKIEWNEWSIDETHPRTCEELFCWYYTIYDIMNGHQTISMSRLY